MLSQGSPKFLENQEENPFSSDKNKFVSDMLAPRVGLEPVSVARTALKLAAGQGFEPQSAGPKPAVLPLDDPAKLTNYQR